MLKNTKVLWIISLITIAMIFSYTKVSIASNKDTINISVGGEPATLDPNLMSGTWENKIAIDLFIGLTETLADGSNALAMATKYNISKDGKTYTFYLRKDAKWSDGRAVTAHDFEFAFTRLLDPKTAAPYASLAYLIKGAQEFNQGKGNKAGVAVKVIDNYTLRITLLAPAPYFLELLAFYVFNPLPKHVVEKYGKDWIKPGNMVSNGAYKLVEWKPKSYVKATRNKNFYDNKNTKIDNIVYYTQEDESAILKRYRAKEIDIIAFTNNQYSWVMKNLKDEAHIAPYLGTYYFSFNMTNPKFKDIRVRKALNLAIDRDFITSKVTKTGEVPTLNFVPNGFKGYTTAQPDWKNLTMKQRIAEAKKLLSEAGYSSKNPLTVEITYNTMQAHKTIAIAIASMWQKIGVNAKLFNKEVAVHYGDMRAANFEVGRAGWVADYVDVSTFIYLFTSNAANNTSKYNNPLYDKAFLEAIQTADTAKQMQLYNQAEQMLIDDNAIIPIYYYVVKNLVSKRVKGWQSTELDRHPTRFLSLAE